MRASDRTRCTMRTSREGGGVAVALAVAVAAVVAAVGVWVFTWTASTGSIPTERSAATSATATSPSPTIGDVDMFLDLRDGSLRPVPEAIANHAGGVGDYQVSPDGRKLLFDGRNGTNWWCSDPTIGCPLTQIYVANVDGSGVRQVTHEPAGAVAATWSPDGSTIAYVAGWGQRPRADLIVLDLGTGETRRLATGLTQNLVGFPRPSFAPDGQTILFTDGGRSLRLVPVIGGQPSHVRVHGEGVWGSYSPDGTLVFLRTAYDCCLHGPEFNTGTEIWLADRERVHSLDVDAAPIERVVWSPDGTRLAAAISEVGSVRVLIIDVASGETVDVVRGATRPTWFDDHTLIVE